MNIDTKICEDVVFGTTLRFKDLKSSGTVPIVFNELKANRYGLENIQLKKTDTIIDIGANVGMFSIYAKKKFGCRIISFEPIPFVFEYFKENIILNGFSLDDFEIYNVGISNKSEDVELGMDIYNTGGASMFKHGSEYVITKCKMDTLAKYVDGTCKYLKIDCEGGEYYILPDILKYINTFDYIGIEYHGYPETKKLFQFNIFNILHKNFSGKVYSS